MERPTNGFIDPYFVQGRREPHWVVWIWNDLFGQSFSDHYG